MKQQSYVNLAIMELIQTVSHWLNAPFLAFASAVGSVQFSPLPQWAVTHSILLLSGEWLYFQSYLPTILFLPFLSFTFKDICDYIIPNS